MPSSTPFAASRQESEMGDRNRGAHYPLPEVIAPVPSRRSDLSRLAFWCIRPMARTTPTKRPAYEGALGTLFLSRTITADRGSAKSANRCRGRSA